MPNNNTAQVVTGRILPLTKRFVNNKIHNFNFEIPPDADNFNANLLMSRKQGEYDNLKKIQNLPEYKTPTQTKKVEVGNGVLIELNGFQKTIMIDGQKIGDNPAIISVSSPLSKAIIGQKVGFSTNFLTQDRNSCSVKITKIISYDDAKKLLFPKQKN